MARHVGANVADGIHVSLYIKAKEQLLNAREELEEANEALSEAIKLGDLSENSEYDAAKDRVRRLQQLVDALEPVAQKAPIQARDIVEVIEPGCLIKLEVFSVTKNRLDENSAEFRQALEGTPQFKGELIFGYSLPVHELVKDQVLSENTPIGSAIIGRTSGEYSVKVPAGFAVIRVEKLKFAEHDKDRFWLEYIDPDTQELRHEGAPAPQE